MKLKLFLIVMIFSGAVQAQTSFDAFWQKFKVAVVKDDKTAVANLTKFSLSMPYGHKSIKTKTQFIRRYEQIINLEANAKRCFQARKPLKDERGNYSIYCAFKGGEEASEDRPIAYHFTKTRTGWKLSGIDNINE